ncbi:MAG: asparagine synthase (glutamine-hydrolyzing), partial [Planctomycetota bacterium]|nr:asparagine synthase (glutamine-hydrolyzing) [Planctomycetota bacterium]
MCGIAGYVGRASVDETRIRRTLELMKNRGPDHQDHAVFRAGDLSVALLHSRLSIIDLDPRANQPLTIGDCTIIFNGEIYNYVELRKNLEQAGVVFKTNSDTEVLLRSYIAHSEKCVENFEGMWSFVIYDKARDMLFLSRDRFAEKPFYYLETADGYYFASEVKFIKALTGVNLSVNMRHMFRYLVNGYRALYKTADTFFNEIKELPFATSALIDRDLRMRTWRHWEPTFAPAKMTMGEAVEGFRERMLEAVRLRLRADVPLAFCLSGGVDSGTVASVAAKCFNYDVATFSILDTDERYNERDNMTATVENIGCRHTFIDIPKADFLQRMRRLVEYHDAPVNTIS